MRERFTYYEAKDDASEFFANGKRIFNKGDIIKVDWNAYDTERAENLTQGTMFSPFCSTYDMPKVEEISKKNAEEARYQQNGYYKQNYRPIF